MSVIQINKDNRLILINFINQIDSKNFRYFNNRDLSCLDNHLYTIIYLDNQIIKGYGHIDFDDKTKKYYLGICVLSKYHHQGIGTIIINNLIGEFNKNIDINELYLTVDKDNINAINLYKKFNFQFVSDYGSYFLMLLSKNFIMLPVSFGEALDKLTILEIKMNKINDERKNDVKIEYEKLKTLIETKIKNCSFYYNLLKKINLTIWEKQDDFRYSTDNHFKNRLCIEIIEENDRRFRIKNKINNIFNSYLKEQKGYNLKNAFITVNHSDNIKLIVSFIRFLSTNYDFVYIKTNNDELLAKFKDDNTIIFVNYILEDKIDIFDLDKSYDFPKNIEEYYFDI